MRKFALILLLFLCLAPVADPAQVGGKQLADGTELQCDLPGEYHRKNTASKGLGLCVFTSIHHSAVHQNIPALQEFPKWLIDKGIPGGGYPSKVDALIPKICAERGYPVPGYIQVEGPWAKVKPVIELACKTNRYVCITYCRSPTKRYGGKSISHMVNLPHADGKWYAFLDNNYVTPKDAAYEWCSEQEAAWAASCGKSVWAIVFLDHGPPPIPVERWELQ